MTIYQIHLKGHLDPNWSQWFDNLTITHTAHGTTILTGPIADQAALYGLLIMLRNLGIQLLALMPIQDDLFILPGKH